MALDAPLEIGLPPFPPASDGLPVYARELSGRLQVRTPTHELHDQLLHLFGEAGLRRMSRSGPGERFGTSTKVVRWAHRLSAHGLAFEVT